MTSLTKQPTDCLGKDTQSFIGLLTTSDFIYLRNLFYLPSIVYLSIKATFFFGDQNCFQGTTLKHKAWGKKETGIVPKTSAHSQHFNSHRKRVGSKVVKGQKGTWSLQGQDVC